MIELSAIFVVILNMGLLFQFPTKDGGETYMVITTIVVDVFFCILMLVKYTGI